MAESPGVVFSISTDIEFRGRQLKSLTPDANGIFKGIPLTVIGMNSRNNICYDKASVLDCLTNESSRFVMNLKSGDLEGELGHPFFKPDPKEMIARLLWLDRTRVSHHITRVYAKDSGNGTMILYGDIKPSGPYKQVLLDNFADPTRNVSFSLRAATLVTKKEGGVTYKRMLAMFTFDAVDGPGYVEASKRFRDPAYESMGIHGLEGYVGVQASKDDFLAATESLQTAGLESKIVDQCVLDAFGCDEVVVKEKVLRKVPGNKFVDTEGSRVSIFDHAFGF